MKVSPTKLEFGEGSMVSEKIKASPEYKKVIDDLIADQKEPIKYYDSFKGIEYTTGDLFAGIGKCTVFYRGNICKTKDGARVDLDITVQDKYDFHFLMKYAKASLDGVLATIANNMAWSDQYFDVISVYDWEAKFKEKR